MTYDSDIEDNEDFPPLYEALLLRNFGEARRLIAEGAALDELIDAGFSEFLHAAAQDGEMEMIEFYLEHDCPRTLEHFDHVQCTPLIWAAQSGCTEAVVRLLSAGVNPNGHDAEKAGDTAIREAVRGGHVEIVTLLLRAGADPTIGGWMNISAVDQAWICTESSHEVMREIRKLLRPYRSSLRDAVHAENRPRKQ